MLYPKEWEVRRPPGRRWPRRIGVAIVLAALAAIAFCLVQYFRPAPKVTARFLIPPAHRAVVERGLRWPSQGSAAVEILGSGAIRSEHGEVAKPLASLTKLMTALVVLKEHPLAAGKAGPSIPIDAADVAAYTSELATSQSVVKVAAGERLTEREALEGLLIPSGNNIARLLATWTAGSTHAFVAKMNALAHSLGLAHTRFVEPSGVAAGNVGTAVDMTRLGAAALANPAIAAIAKLGEVNLPVAGTVVNYDYDVGHDGVVGIKTGSSTEAEGNFVFAVRRKIDGRTTTAVGAVLHQEGASELQAALNAGERLAASALADARPITILPARAAAVRISAPWSSASIVCRTTKPLSFFGLPAKAEIVTRLSPGLSASHVRAREQVGTVTATVDGSSYSSPVVAPTALPGPSLRYRLTRF